MRCQTSLPRSSVKNTTMCGRECAAIAETKASAIVQRSLILMIPGRLACPKTALDSVSKVPGLVDPAKGRPNVLDPPSDAAGPFTGCFSGCQEKPQGSLGTPMNILFGTLLVSRRYAASRRKSRGPKSSSNPDPSRKETLRSPLRHLRRERRRPRPVRERVRRSRTEPAGQAPQVRGPVQNPGAGRLPQWCAFQ